MPDASVNGIRLYYEEHGSGEPILCIHGGGSTAMMWEDAFGDLSRLGRVIGYDRRGCSRSERPDPYQRTTVAKQADDAAALLDALDAWPAIVIGRSYGGAVAVELALRNPDRVLALALLEGDALGLSAGAREWTREIRSRLLEIAGSAGAEAVFPAAMDAFVGDGTWDGFPEEVRRILAPNGDALLADLAYVDEPMPDARAFATIAKPVLLLAASDSPAPQREMTEVMAAALPNARLERVEGGHLINPASPEVLRFVEDVLGSD